MYVKNGVTIKKYISNNHFSYWDEEELSDIFIDNESKLLDDIELLYLRNIELNGEEIEFNDDQIIILEDCCCFQNRIINGNVEIINNGEYGNLFKCGDSDDFAKKLIKTCTDTHLLQHTICNSKKYVEDKYSYKKTLQPLNKWVIKKLGDQNE